jgi:hypothetical protein
MTRLTRVVHRDAEAHPAVVRQGDAHRVEVECRLVPGDLDDDLLRRDADPIHVALRLAAPEAGIGQGFRLMLRNRLPVILWRAYCSSMTWRHSQPVHVGKERLKEYDGDGMPASALPPGGIGGTWLA